MCECAYIVNNWFFGYQVYCTSPVEFWINPLGYVVLFILSLWFLLNIGDEL